MAEGGVDYEFDAPSQVVDFGDLDKVDDADTWFDYQTGAQCHLTTPLQSRKKLERGEKRNLPKATVAPRVKTESDPGCAVPSNIVTSWSAGAAAQPDVRPRIVTSNPPPAGPRRVSKRKKETVASTAPPDKKHRGNTTNQLPQRSSSARHRKGAQTTAQPVSASTEQSSEEVELERIRTLQQEVALHRKKNEASYKAALAGIPPPKKLVLSTTIPQEFHFSTDSRVKAAPASDTAHKEFDFVSQLRKQPASPAKAAKGATVPKPFHLSTGAKRSAEEPAAYMPMAQQIVQYEKRTPSRYHLRSRESKERGPSPVKRAHMKLTQPHTPNLVTQQRSRSTTVKSSSDLEAEEAEQLHKFRFKALELNRKILEGTESLKKPAVKQPTVPEGFELQIEKRLQERQATSTLQEPEQHTFKSQPLPRKILEGVVGLPEKKVQPPTVPESPAFALKNRVRVEREVDEVKPPPSIKVAPVPHFGVPFQPQLPEDHHVKVCPFSFEEREQERRILKEKKLEQMRNEEVPLFKAQPLPDFNAKVLPEKKKLEPTKPEPFKLLTDERGVVRTSRWEQTVKEEQKQQEKAALFKARPNTVTHKEPFQPRKENRPTSVPEPFELLTEQRARGRQEFERLVNEKESLRACLEEEQRQEEERHQKQEVAKLRQDQVHKAQPVRHYKPVSVKKSEVPLTIAQSPNFSDRFAI
ncbi:targeting protein for Xklp2 [Thalassophryne amazonica]|uniref:targeting protein for Xklp2 n=1 Tax=Thalassophryne amazonica TaxID=390379 RepID=UPI001470A2A2|nr:targeting protein for Xklp2 [Thalassophryne amazonica]